MKLSTRIFQLYWLIFPSIFNVPFISGSLLVLECDVVLESIFGVKVSFTQVASVFEGPAEVIAFHVLLQIITLAAFELTNCALVHFKSTLIIRQFGHILLEVTP